MTGRGHDKVRVSSQKPSRATLGDACDVLLALIAEREAWRSVVKSGYPIHSKVQLEICRYLSIQKIFVGLVGETDR